jgi:hypothetical protein
MTGENLRPRRAKLEIPGWAGQPEPRIDGSHEYAWHCVPFSEAAHYGIEVFYPYANELRVTTTDGRLVFDGDFGPPPDEERNWPPFRTFGEQFYTYQILLDLKVEAGVGSHLGVRISNFPPKKPSNVRISTKNILTFDGSARGLSFNRHL